MVPLNPHAITGQAPASSAAALGTAEADVSKSISAVQGALASLQQRMSEFQTSRSSKAPGGGLGPVSLAKVSGHGVSLPKVSLPSLSVPSFSFPSVSLPSSSAPSFNQPLDSVKAISLPSITLPSVTLP